MLKSLQTVLRPTIKRIIYKRLYGGEVTFSEFVVITIYRRLPNSHPLVYEVLSQEKSDWVYNEPYWEKQRALARRRFLLISLVVVVAFLTAGCAHFDVDEKWEAVPSHKPLPHQYVKVANLEQICGWAPAPGSFLYGCAQRIYEENICIIFHKHELTPWQREHEEKHCAGYSHEIIGVSRIARRSF